MGPFDGTYTSLWNDDLKPDNVDIYTYLEIFFPVWKTDGVLNLLHRLLLKLWNCVCRRAKQRHRRLRLRLVNGVMIIQEKNLSGVCCYWSQSLNDKSKRSCNI